MNAETSRVDPGETVRNVIIPAGHVSLAGELAVPENPLGLVIFAHGSGSSRNSPRNRTIARSLRRAGFGTLLFDLITEAEDPASVTGRHLAYNMALLTNRLIQAAHWLAGEDEARHLRLGFFGSNTGGGAALVAAADLGRDIGAVVVRGGRVDLAGGALRRVKSPTLLIVGELDDEVLEYNEETCELLSCPRKLVVIPNATHLFEETGALEEVSRLGTAWFQTHLAGATATDSRLNSPDWSVHSRH